jgi:hypothetical protein
MATSEHRKNGNCTYCSGIRNFEERKPVDFLEYFGYLLLDMLIKEKFQGEKMKEASGEIQVKNGVDFHRPFCTNLNGSNGWNPQKPGRNLAGNEKTVYGENHKTVECHLALLTIESCNQLEDLLMS